MAARGYLFEGSLYMQAIVNGVLAPAVGPLEGTQFAIQPNSTSQDLISRGRGTSGQILESVPTQEPAEFSITFAEGSPEVMAMGLMGSVAALSQTSGSVVDEPVSAKLNRWVFLNKSKVSSVVVKNEAGTVTYVNGQDYIVNTDMGWIKALAGGAITDNQAIEVSYSHAAITGSRILGATTPDLRARFIMDGVNRADGKDCRVTVWEAIVAPNQALDLLANGFVTTALTGRMKTPSGFLSPFIVDLHA